MPELDLDELERLAAQATPGPWDYDATGVFKWHFLLEKRHVCECMTEANAAYIVAACNAVPELIKRVRELEFQMGEVEFDNSGLCRENDALKRQRDWLASQHAKACLDAANDACTWNTGDCPVCPLDKGGRCLEVTSKTFIEAAEKAAKEAGE